MRFRAAVLVVSCFCINAIAEGQATSTAGERPFTSVAVALKVGVEGAGFDVASPLSRKVNLRSGASFFSYSHQFTEDGIQIDPTITLRKASLSVDYCPWGGSFRLSPGVVLHNGNRAHASAMVAAGQRFDLNDQTYYSSATDPLHGTADVRFGNSVAPSLTLGWGNMVPRSGKHFSVPFEVGFEYIGRPTLTYDFAGSACNTDGCAQVQGNPEFQANRVAEQAKLNSDLAPLRFYPILSLGVGYRF